MTSVEQGKINEALELRNHAKDLLNEDSFVVLNKCLSDKLEDWTPDLDDKVASLLKESFAQKENRLKNNLNHIFKNILEFNEVFKISPLDHVRELTKNWEKYAT